MFGLLTFCMIMFTCSGTPSLRSTPHISENLPSSMIEGSCDVLKSSTVATGLGSAIMTDEGSSHSNCFGAYCLVIQSWGS